ncbi:MAG: glutamine synthetase beta-grasp domain-containing protein, partial [Pseudomonadota bacterium]
MTTSSDVLNLIKEKEVKYVDFRFCDTRGKEQHVTVPSHQVKAILFTEGKMFDGSSIAGWKGINESDMILMPDPATAVLDPFFEETTLNLRCNIIEPATMQGYERDPRSLGLRAEAYLKSTGIADGALFGPENEFFIFDSVKSHSAMNSTGYTIDSYTGAWNSNTEFPNQPNLGHRPGVKGGYFPVPPVDAYQDIRSSMCNALGEMGLDVEVHHHEVATGGQCEIGVGAGGLVRKADEVLILKYVIQQVAAQYGKTATFMPKPLVGDNGSGMHVHQSLQKAGQALFAGDKYGGLSETALFYIGGIIKHAKAINAFTNP